MWQPSRAVKILGAIAALWMAGERLVAQDPQNTRMLESPAVSARQIAFSYDGDLWVADRDGGNPRRLTRHPGNETSPRFSPDGMSLAFSAEYDGNVDVYLVAVSGGSPQRLTYHPDADVVEGFTPDGKAVLFSSGRNSFTSRYRQLFTVPVTGGWESQLPVPNGLRASYSADGRKLAYIPIPERFQQWKNYRGGTCSRVWIYDVADHSVVMVPQPEGRCNDTNPVFIGDRVYFRSDRNGEFNLFSFEPGTKEVKQWTNFGEFPVQDLSGCADAIILEQAGYLHLFDPATGKTTPLKIGISTDAIETRARFVSGNQWIRGAAISPSGARAVFEYRGEIVTVPAEKGDPRNLTNSPGVHERSPSWSPDGKSIAWFSDEGGEYHLVVAPQTGVGERKKINLVGNGFFEEPKWSPDGKKISYRDNSWSLYVLEIDSGRCEKVTSEPQYGPSNLRGLHHSWSADSQWLAYTVNTPAMIQQAHVYSVAENKSWPISDGLSEVSEPTFDPSGKYLYFFASTDAGPVKHWFAMSNADMESSNQLYVAVLQNEGLNPFMRESDEETPKAESAAGKSAAANQAAPTSEKAGTEGDKAAQGSATSAAGATGPAALRIDFSGLNERIVAAPLPAARHSNLSVGAEGQIFLIKEEPNGNRSLVNFSLKTRKPTVLIDSGVSGFTLTPDGKKFLYAAGGNWGIAESGGKLAPGGGKLNTEAIQVRVEPRSEWNQIFEEVWRINRDYFYDPGMHGCNWAAMRERYRQFLPHCVTRDDLNRVLMWMCSELAVGHHRVGGGEDITEAKRVPGGLLGADFEIDSGRYRVKKVYGGLNWNGELRSPLTEPGVRVAAGEYLLAIGGVELRSDDNLYRLLETTAGKVVTLKVGAKPDGSDAREVSVVPVASEAALRNRDWIERNLQRVHEATEGRVAYVYVPNTTRQGHEYFKRYFFPQTDKQAIIVDERFNGGGQVADYYIDHLRRPYVSHWATRYGKDFITPTGAIFGPKVMLIDETAGSGGDLLPYMFRKLGVGTLVGRRTWGGLVGVLGFPVLMDGGSVSAPNLAIWTEEGFVVENEGVPPDIEVEQMPADVIAGRDPQLEKAIEVVLKQLAENPPPQYKKPAYPIRARK
ncbi:MAG: PDZ domain-containing protein [Planctomycetota bacterium]